MFEGRVEAIFVGPSPGGPMQPVEEARLRAVRGIDGDRYQAPEGPSPAKH